MRPDDEEKRAPGEGWGDHFSGLGFDPTWVGHLGHLSSVTPASDSSFEMKGWAKKSLRVTPDSLKNAVSCERPFLNYHTPDHCVGSSDWVVWKWASRNSETYRGNCLSPGLWVFPLHASGWLQPLGTRPCLVIGLLSFIHFLQVPEMDPIIELCTHLRAVEKWNQTKAHLLAWF